MKPNKREGAGDLDQAVFMSDVARKKEGQEEFQDDEENVQVAQVDFKFPIFIDFPQTTVVHEDD